MSVVLPTHYKVFSTIPFRAGVIENPTSLEHPIGVVAGVRTMGGLIAESIVAAGYQTLLGDVDYQICERAEKNINAALSSAVKAGTFSQELYASVNKDGLIGPSIVLDSNTPKTLNKDTVRKYLLELLGADILDLLERGTFFVEAGPEKVSVKEVIHAIYSAVMQKDGNPHQAITTSNTSGKTLEEMGKFVLDKTRFALFHFLFPGRVNNVVVELGFGNETSPETILRLQNLSRKMGIKPVICFKDSPGALGNRFLTGLLSEESRIYDEGLGSVEYIDQVLHEVLYGDLKLLKTGRALREFEYAPGLRATTDESKLYLAIEKIDKGIRTKSRLEEKKSLLFELQRKLNQKLLYAGIVEDFERVGSFYKPSKFIGTVKGLAQNQLNKLNEYMKKVKEDESYLYNPLEMNPYQTPESANGWHEKGNVNREIIRDRILGTYLSIAQELYNEGLATKHDIQTICTDGYKWIIGPFELANKLGARRVNDLLGVVNRNLPLDKPTGICKPSDDINVNPISSTEDEICGVQTYVQQNIGFIDLSRTSVQHLDTMQNLLNPAMLKGIHKAIDQLEGKVDAIFIRSQGGNVFSAGIDLDYLDSKVSWDKNEYEEYMKLTNKVMDRIEACQTPVTAIIDGAAVSSGAGLALACDHRIMTDTAFIQFTDLAVGNIPASGVIKRLAALVGKKLTERLICRPKLLKILPDTPRQFTKMLFGGQRLYGKSAEKVGFADTSITRDKIDVFMADLIENKVDRINIYEKSRTTERKNYDKSDYPIFLGDGLGVPFWFNSRWFTRQASNITRDAIVASHDPTEVERIIDRATEVSITSSKQVTEQYINRLKSAATGNWGQVFTLHGNSPK